MNGNNLSYHFSMDIRGALRNKSFDGFKKNDGTKATNEEARMFLMDQLAQGREQIPLSKDCVGFCYVNGCPGHEN